MNKEQIIDKAYENYEKSYEMGKHLEGTGLLSMAKETKGTFIYRSKTDSEFSQKWGLKIEEQEILKQIDQTNPILKGSTTLVPTKLITITYNNETIESCE